MGQLLLTQAPFEKSARINARRAVRLKKHQVAAVLRITGMKEMVKAHLKQVGRARVTGDVPAQIAVGLIGPHHHGQGIPAHQRGQALLNGQIAREHRLLVHRNGVDIGRVQIGLPTRAQGPRAGHQQVQNLTRSLAAVLAGLHQRSEGIKPLGGLLGIGVLAQGRHLQPAG